jgi:hypothetical protein
LTSDIWELRWTAADLPALSTAWTTKASTDLPSLELEERDVYVLTPSRLVNLKLRRRTNALKLKRLGARSSDGFERWRTEFDAPLPVDRSVAESTLDLLDARSLIEPLLAASTTDEALAVISVVCSPDRFVEVRKRRELYRHAQCVADDAQLQVGRRTFRSIGVESASVRELRRFVGSWRRDQLGQPRNYMEFAHDLATGHSSQFR